MVPGLLAFVGFVALTVLYGRHVWHRRHPRVPHLLALWLAVAAALAFAVTVCEPNDRSAVTLANLAVYLFLGEAYIFVYILPIGSVSVRLLLALLERESQPDAFECVLATHSPATFLEVRLQSLVTQGLLVVSGSQYRITAKGRRWARVARLLKRFLAVGAGG